uniref:PIH1 N-terminal domain-containing protein n=1 Tax=Sinocyclocheilus grahami TaxID=75366 RepID=A0A672PUK1_SINGR
MVTESSLLAQFSEERSILWSSETSHLQLTLEKDRGTSVQFIHPEAHHVLKTRGARDKLFINICSDQLIDKPSCEAATGRDGEAGYNWRLPFSLTPGRPDRDAAGRSCVVYDVIFHPDALQAAEHSARLLELLHSTAVRGVQDAFHVPLDSSSVKQLKMKYKGVPQAAVIRRPIPGEPQQGSSDPEPEPGASCPTKPHYTVKYRSVDAEVSVQERRLVLDSQKPATRSQRRDVPQRTTRAQRSDRRNQRLLTVSSRERASPTADTASLALTRPRPPCASRTLCGLIWTLADSVISHY